MAAGLLSSKGTVEKVPMTGDHIDPTTSVLTITPNAVRVASILTKNLGRTEPNRAICGRCRGKKFDCFTVSRSARKCPQCKGEGSIVVGSTKR